MGCGLRSEGSGVGRLRAGGSSVCDGFHQICNFDRGKIGKGVRHGVGQDDLVAVAHAAKARNVPGPESPVVADAVGGNQAGLTER